ncbi:MAG: NAD(P)/FAD-dependent oxidoreductase [Phyllobacterium sp.]
MKHYDVVIVGGAIVGASVAWFLREEGFKGSIALIERDPHFTYSSTTLSAASIRQQFSEAENIRLSQFGLSMLRDLKRIFGEDADVGFHEMGYLVLASQEGLPILRRNHEVQKSVGADIALEDAAALAKRYPWMSLEGVAAGALGLSGEGWFDAHGLLMLIRKGLKARDIDFITGEVSALSVANGLVTGVTLADGTALSCSKLVNAAGPAGGKVAALAGLKLPVEPRKRTVFVFKANDQYPDMPMLIDPSGLYVRPEGNVYITGISPSEEQDGPAEPGDFEPDWGLFEEVIWPTLAERVPSFEAIKMERAWAGHYDYNTLDQNAVIGPHRDIPNFLFCNGFSGHGLQQGPGAGRAIAELITHGAYKSIDCSVFSHDRIEENKPFFELNVI